MNGFKNTLIGAVVFLALGVSVPQALGAPIGVSACQTISVSGSYELTNNINATGDCFILTADFITLDLDGYTIAGNGSGSAIKGNNVTRKGVTVRNGTIRQFANGIDFLSYGLHFVVERMRILDNTNLGVGLNSQAIVKDSIFSGNATGIYVGSRSVVTGNSAMSNYDGIKVGSGSTVIGNTSGINTHDGIIVGNGSTITDNVAHGNDRYGFFVECRSNLVGNAATLSGTSNFFFNTSMGVCNQSHNLAP